MAVRDSQKRDFHDLGPLGTPKNGMLACLGPLCTPKMAGKSIKACITPPDTHGDGLYAGIIQIEPLIAENELLIHHGMSVLCF